MARFVILEHDHPVLHWDLMLEAGDGLRTWRLASTPRPGQTVAAEETFRHRTLYLDYEGPVSGDRGRVRRWDAGTFTGDPEGEAVEVQLAGSRLRGLARLVSQEGGSAWHFAED